MLTFAFPPMMYSLNVGGNIISRIGNRNIPIFKQQRIDLAFLFYINIIPCNRLDCVF